MTVTELLLYGGALLFCLGLFLVVTRRNAVMALIGIELILNGANLNFVAFARQDPELHGQMAGLFIIVLAAAEVAVSLAIILNVYKRYNTVNLDVLDNLKE